MPKNHIIIALPSLIHRIGREALNEAKKTAITLGCQFSRVRRSRNWSLSGEAIKIQQLNSQLQHQGNQNYHYLIQKVDRGLLEHVDKLEPLEDKLIRLMTENPSMTLAELMQLTDCDLAQARSARFQVDCW
ncbi:ribosome recycling factor family protein [Shewanella intestini]|uniref:Ribosome recycling factor n=1 Tax=Shewanella intestini TaxID=2017544 RepID=A0ABS5I3U8_9GAMM|nr:MULTISPECIES: ribosome recycling factor family protein [Shewanella]MBR9728050.1 ribosome recycling factor [Shewanella intestini]MRG36398.1 ribosome recycling factor [Shewanella sp. XMDDZSB0408]